MRSVRYVLSQLGAFQVTVVLLVWYVFAMPILWLFFRNQAKDNGWSSWIYGDDVRKQF